MKTKSGFFALLAMWAGGWHFIDIVNYLVGVSVSSLAGREAHSDYLQLAGTAPFLFSCLVLLLIYFLWRSFQWKAIFWFVCFDAVSILAASWQKYEQFVDLTRSDGRRGGFTTLNDPSFWNLFAEPMLDKMMGYGIAGLLIIILFKRPKAQALDVDAAATSPTVGSVHETSAARPFVAIFCAFAALSFLEGLLMKLGGSGMAHFDVSMPFRDAPNGLLYPLAASLVLSAIWFLLGGRFYERRYGTVTIGRAFAASVTFSIAMVLGSILPYLLIRQASMPIPWQAILHSLGMALVFVGTRALFFWLGARARKKA